MKYIGKFNSETGKIVVSDPCYQLDTWCARTFNSVKGEWYFFSSETPDGRSAIMYCRHIHALGIEHYPEIGEESLCHFIKVGTLGVDSGTMSVSDRGAFKELKKMEWGDVCEEHLFKNKYPFVNSAMGAVSETGGSDGDYPLMISLEEGTGKVDQILITFSDIYGMFKSNKEDE